MADALEELPLFPLNVVLFPHASLQIHVFEDRYRKLIQQCLHEDRGFGIVLIRSGQEVGGAAEPYLVGTAVRIESVHTFENGTMDVHVRGERRFRIRRLDESGEYLIGHVEPVIELSVDDEPRTDALALKVREYMMGYLQNLFSPYDFKSTRIVLPQDATALSFAVANMLRIENLDKQRLLETTDTIERMAEMIPILEQQIMLAKPAGYQKLTSADFKESLHPN